ncbi:hypothetical protein BP00DRAFT_427061 [Aspergillus indologenus CBS 114.80]|uniref:Protein kinase domain-containing protein n=1 Tax=Aspergillus indologenus CBS 114.80 TaxID=1450541 RepID=A0A2V5I3Z3_9EURO|nr:hypothetical protein BP00DRAFT_427061 [Aspergillus indologenus CBS 114.80]
MEQRAYETGAFLFNERKRTARITVHVLDNRFIIRLCEKSFQQSPSSLEKFLLLLGRLEGKYEPDEGDALEDMHDWVLEPFVPTFELLLQHKMTRAYTFDDWLFSETLRYTVIAKDDKLTPVCLAQPERARNADVAADLTIDEGALTADCSIFPIYSPQEIEIPAYTSSMPAVPRKVFVKGQPSFLKVVWAGDAKTTIRELSEYAKIHSAGFEARVYTSTLNGLIKDGNGCVVGLLLNYIECGDHGTLDFVNVSDPRNLRLKQKWYDQIEGTLRQLHLHGIVWGDAAATNVLIDEKNNAYLVDFGGGYTPGWVERENSNSTEGDLQGLERIRQFLFS